MLLPLWLLVSVAAASFAILYAVVPRFISLLGQTLGNHIRSKTKQRRELLLARAKTERQQYDEKQTQTTVDEEWEKIDHRSSNISSDRQTRETNGNDWDGIVGFFHPFCNAGGGGERVLWAAIKATQDNWPKALCAVYTGDHEVNKEQILHRVQERFNIHLHPPSVTFLYLSTRQYVLSSTWPRFTLLGQSLGSLVLGYDAFMLLDPDIYIDTMGYAFTIALCKFLFPDVPTAAYVHYPTISTDMLDSLYDASTGRGVNAGTGKGWKGTVKRYYWHAFAWLYGWVGGSTDVVMTNSSWTVNHIRSLWSAARTQQRRTWPLEVVFPPVAVEELERSIEVSHDGEGTRHPTLVYIAQFRPEKDHQLILKSFAKLLQNMKTKSSTAHLQPHLTLIGSVRNSSDETYIYSLRLLAHELQIKDRVTFLLNAPWDDRNDSKGTGSILSHLRSASIGVNAMWNEHFGIGVVEYQAAGLISVVHDSGGPRRDIVVDYDGKDEECGSGPTGFRASDVDGFARAYEEVLYGMSAEERFRMRVRARRNASRFGEEVFAGRWVRQMQRLIDLREGKAS